MTENIQQSSKDIAVVIYDSPLPPRYFRFSKKFFKTLFFVVPVFIGLIFLSLIVWGLSGRLTGTTKASLPQIVSEDDSKLKELEAEVNELKKSNLQMADKLAGNTGFLQEEPYLLAIKKPYGMQNFTSLNKVSLDQFSVSQEQGKTYLKFQIISTNPETKVTGHVIVFMLSLGSLAAYPQEANSNIGQGIKYSLGEPFAVSRLRPTNAEFSYLPLGENFKFIIYIFTREGDLLLIKETPQYQVGQK
jgi:hypothetical protein